MQSLRKKGKDESKQKPVYKTTDKFKQKKAEKGIILYQQTTNLRSMILTTTHVRQKI